MNKKIIIGAIVTIVVVGGGIGAYVMSRNADNDANNGLNSQTTESMTSAATFSPVPNDSVSFEATLTGKAEREYTATLRYDGKGNSSYSSDYGDGAFTMYMFGDEYISCYGETCFRLPDSNGDGNASEATQTYSEEDVNTFRNAATLKQASVKCGDETCSVWDVKTKTFEGTFYLDSKQRMKKVEGAKDGTTWTMEYTYKPVTITRPANVTDSPMI